MTQIGSGENSKKISLEWIEFLEFLSATIFIAHRIGWFYRLLFSYNFSLFHEKRIFSNCSAQIQIILLLCGKCFRFSSFEKSARVLSQSSHVLHISQNCIVSLEQSSLAKPESNRPKRIRPFDELPWKFRLSSSNVCAMLASFSSSSPSSSSCMRQKLSDKFFFGYLRSTRKGVLSLLRIDTSIDMLHGLNSHGLNFWIGLSSPNRSIEVELTLNFALFKTSEAASWSQIFRSGVRGGGESETVATAHGDRSWISGLSVCWINSFLRSVLMFIIELLPAARSLVLAISSWSLSVNMLYFLSIASTSRGNCGGRVSWVWHAISFLVTALAVDNATSVSMCSSRRTIFCLRSQQSWGDGTEIQYMKCWKSLIVD